MEVQFQTVCDRPGNINPYCHIPDMVFKAISTAKYIVCRRPQWRSREAL